MSIYTLQAVDNLIERYINRGGEIVTITDGVLGYGTTLLVGDNLKTIVIQEKYLNEWSSGHTIRTYNVTPKKYKEYVK